MVQDIPKHHGSTKMYHDLKQIYWWDGMKDIVEYMTKCTNYKQVKEENFMSSGVS